MQNTKAKEMQVEGELSLADIIQFFNFNLKFLGLTTVCLSAITIILPIFLLKQYQKQVTLLVKPVQAFISKPIPSLEVNQINTVVELLQSKSGAQLHPDAGKITTKAKYNPTTQRLEVSMRSADPSLLDVATPKLINQLKAEFPETLKQTIQTSITSTELQIERNQASVAFLEKQVGKLKLSPNQSNPQEIQTNPQEIQTSSQETRTIARLEALERQRANYLTAIATLRYDTEYLEKVQKNPVEFADKVIVVQMLSESGIKQTPSLLQVVVFAIFTSFVAAILAAIIRNHIAPLRKELHKNKVDSSKGV